MATIIEYPDDDEINEFIDRTILATLQTQAIQYNESHSKDAAIDLDRVKSIDELAISLWQRGEKTVPIFGEPFDEVFANFENHQFFKTQIIQSHHGVLIEPMVPRSIDQSCLYQLLRNRRMVVGILSVGLELRTNPEKSIISYLYNPGFSTLWALIDRFDNDNNITAMEIINGVLAKLKNRQESDYLFTVY